MDKPSWQHEYKRLLTAYGKKANQEQSAEFYAALASHTGAAVHDGTSTAIREGKYFPTVAELLAQVRNASHRHTAPVDVCETCQGSSWTQHQCDGVLPASAQGERPRPANLAHFCGVGDCPHQWHGYAKRCHCWPFRQEQHA